MTARDGSDEREATSPLATIERPNGKPYRPRKVIAYGVYDEDECPVGVVAFGTHEIGRAQALADLLVKHDLLDGRHVPVDPCCVWWCDSFEGGRRAWVTDAERGRAGVWFREIVERSQLEVPSA